MPRVAVELSSGPGRRQRRGVQRAALDAPVRGYASYKRFGFATPLPDSLVHTSPTATATSNRVQMQTA